MAEADHSSLMLQTMNERRKKGEFCDFEIRVQDETFPVHQIVLDTVSPYFRTMFSSNMIESKQGYCELHDVTTHAVRTCITMMYTGQLELDKATVSDILKVAHMWQLDKAVEKCENLLKENLDLSTCVESKKLATLYDLKDLCEKANEFILENVTMVVGLSHLDEQDVIDLLRVGTTHDVHPSELWKFYIEWIECNSDEFGSEKKHLFCRVVLAFPVKKFSIYGFGNHVWVNPHVESCENCKHMLAKKILIDHGSMKTVDLKPFSCVLLKQLSKAYGFSRLESVADDYIVKNHYKIFNHSTFVEIESEDLLKYINQINEKCSLKEFTGIVEWLKQDESHHGAFQDVFECLENQQKSNSSMFLSSLRDIQNFALKKSWRVEFAKFHDRWLESWWPKDCFFLKTLAQKYEYKTMEAKLDECIVRSFSHTAKLDGCKELHMEDIIKYLSMPELYRTGEDEIVWKGVNDWIEHDAESRTEEFPKIFAALHLDKFSTKFLRKVVNFPLVKESKSSMSHLVTILLQRVQSLEETVSKSFEDHEKRLRALEKNMRKGS